MAKDGFIQAIRGLAIAAVVGIHCLPQCAATVAVRPLLNWSVAAFLFLSGYLTSESKVDRGGVIAGRLRKVLVPYLVWSVLALLATKSLSVGGVVAGILLGAASAQMYYLLVYAQLVVLTPALFKLLRSHRALAYAVTPVFLLAREVAALLGIALPHVQVLFPAWMVYYVMGLDWGRVGKAVRRVSPALPAVFLVCLIVQEAVGFAWLNFGDYNMATTQLKLSSMAGSIVVALMVGTAGPRARSMVSRDGLVRLGNASFGVYLCHLLVLRVVGKAIGFVGLSLSLATIAKWALTLGLSYALMRLSMRFLPRRLCGVLGFV